MKYLAADTVFYIIMKAREFDVKVEPEGMGRDSDAVDDGCLEILEDYGDDATEDELHEALANLNEDQLHELVALMWLGRGTYSKEEWADAQKEAYDADPTAKSSPEYLMGEPLLSDYLEEGLSVMGVSIEEFEVGRL
ncbi:DUF3775 domain-containing protein [Terasakiella sp. A23]|uniref:DUF3775 domain-containing protein n=1 Tax=Terasakiella sp. FCG-A23 TaxID=3080561 RepID=UPI002953C4F1|nr:DUF3775 domain-containing protein [Terasakiella sp. A23]MDV7338309.1 DUF3775 domain-containing protein [Terasakiella sp. A23]